MQSDKPGVFPLYESLNGLRNAPCVASPYRTEGTHQFEFLATYVTCMTLSMRDFMERQGFLIVKLGITDIAC